MREVLKHKSITEAVMIEIDEELTCLSREYLPEWSDCSDILVIHERSSGDGEEMSSLVSCFDDPRS